MKTKINLLMKANKNKKKNNNLVLKSLGNNLLVASTKKLTSVIQAHSVDNQ